MELFLITIIQTQSSYAIAGSRYAKRIYQLGTKPSMCFHKIKLGYMENRRIHKSIFLYFIFSPFLHILLYLCILYSKVLKTYVFQVFGNYSKHLIFNISSKCCPWVPNIIKIVRFSRFLVNKMMGRGMLSQKIIMIDFFIHKIEYYWNLRKAISHKKN